MNDKKYEQQKKRVIKLWKKWRIPLGLGWWRIELIYSREHVQGDTAYAPPSNNGDFVCIFDVKTNYYYRMATITAYLPVIQDVNDESLERYFIHECMHIILKAMSHKNTAKEEESVATMLADAILWTVKGVKNKKI